MYRVKTLIRSISCLFLSTWAILFFPCNLVYAGPLDPAKVVGPESCRECHKSVLLAMPYAKHYKSFETMPQSKKAKEIAKKLGIKRIKREGLCLSCHFTVAKVAGKDKAIAGVSCESCHGAARDWVKVHGDYGGKDVNRYTETPEHKEKRIEHVKANGMVRLEQTYRLAENCYRCHIVINEKLVNEGGHHAVNDFELVAWNQGEVRHNFLRTRGFDNEEPDLEFLIMMYVSGRALDLEYSLRGVAKATKKAIYAISMAKRVRANEAYLREILEKVSIPEVEEMLAISKSVELKTYQEAALTGAADRVAEVTKRFVKNYDGSEFEMLEELVPTEEQYKGEVFEKD